MVNDWRLILENRLTRVRTFARIDSDDRMQFCDVMSADDANRLADRVAEERAENTGWRYKLRRSTQNHHTHVATIPAVIVNDLMRDGIWGNAERMEKWLNNPDNKIWRTGGGRLKIKDA